MDINNRLKQLRKQKGISQEEAAELLGVSLSSYQKYEREKNSVTPSIEVLIKLAAFYNVSTDYLLGVQEQPNPLAMLNISVNDKKFIEIYTGLSDTHKQIFVDTMIKLSEAAEQDKRNHK